MRCYIENLRKISSGNLKNDLVQEQSILNTFHFLEFLLFLKKKS